MRAKFRCQSIENFDGGSEQAKLQAVTSGYSEENSQFNTATPSGDLSIYIDNPKAKGFFKPGKEYYLDFTEAE